MPRRTLSAPRLARPCALRSVLLQHLDVYPDSRAYVNSRWSCSSASDRAPERLHAVVSEGDVPPIGQDTVQTLHLQTHLDRAVKGNNFVAPRPLAVQGVSSGF